MKHSRWILALVPAVALALGGAGTGTPWERSTGISELLTLVSSRPGVLGSALVVSQWPRQTALRRILLQTPEGGRLILTKVQHPTQGMSLLSLEDDPSGWTMTLTERSELTFDDIEETLDPGRLSARWKKASYRSDWTLVAPGMAPLILRSTTGDVSLGSQLAEAIHAQGQGEAVRGAMPPSLLEEIEFLGALLDNRQCVGSFLEFEPLDSVLRSLGAVPGGLARGYGSLQWEPVTAMRQRGVVLETGLAHEFARGFRSLDSVRPLSDVFEKE
jgi:hypothetical protein